MKPCSSPKLTAQLCVKQNELKDGSSENGEKTPDLKIQLERFFALLTFRQWSKIQVCSLKQRPLL
jgi:hypothetical protein